MVDTFKNNLNQTGEIGFVEEIVHSIAYVNGLPGACPHELVIFEDGSLGEVLSLTDKFVEVLIFSEGKMRVGSKVTRSNKTLEIPVGNELLGESIYPLGNPLDSTRAIKKITNFRPVDTHALGIDVRKRVQRPFDTGVTLIDMMLPLGKGQRQLLIGDRKTGKTNFILRTILTQARQGNICIYVGIGKKKLDIKKVEEFCVKNKIMKNVIIIASSPQDPSGIIYLTPYAGMTIAEYFRDQGKDVLLILDDLSSHAKFYREISLLGRRFPGRNSYPGDIFYIHAKLLERAGNFIVGNGENSITCLPIAETTQGDLSGYIQTNIMSMTDGHIFFDNDLFAKGRRPAINPFLSVTRVGHQTQSVLRREINRELTSFLTLFEKMQNFVHFGAELNENIRNILSTGDRIIRFFNQTSRDIIPPNVQTFLFCLLWLGAWNNREQEEMEKEMLQIITGYETQPLLKKKIDDLILKAKSFNELLVTVKVNLDSILAQFKITNQAQPGVSPSTQEKVSEEPDVSKVSKDVSR